MTVDDVERIVEERLRLAFEVGRRPNGLLFHGTCEDVEGDLKGGGYDGVLWTATTPAIAQQYIPSSGSTVIIPRPNDWELDDRIRPDEHSWWHALAKTISGTSCADVETGSDGRATSWTPPEGWPTYRDCIRHVEEVLGYRPSAHGGYEIKQHLTDLGFVDKPANWQIQGTLFITPSDGFRFKDLRRSEDGDLMDLEYHDVDGFGRAIEEGFDGVIINDFAQVDGHGNVGHVSYGLLPPGLSKARWVRMEAIRRPLEGSWWTPDVEKWLESRETTTPAVNP